MLGAQALDRIRVVLHGIAGVRGFAVVLYFDEKTEVLLNNSDPVRAMEAIADTAGQYAKAVSEERPIRLN